MGICTRLAQGEALTHILKPETMPHYATVMRWLADEDKATFREMYARAREMQADYLADEIIEIADDSGADLRIGEDGELIVDGEAINRARLRVDARKWYASKVAPKKYGDIRIIAGDPDNPLTVRHKHEMRDDELTAIALGGRDRIAPPEEGED